LALVVAAFIATELAIGAFALRSVWSYAVAAVLSTTARHELRDRLLRRFGRNLTTLGPLLTGAAVAAFLNRRATLKLADEVRRDLASRQ
jgi:hypothetical protein